MIGHSLLSIALILSTADCVDRVFLDVSSGGPAIRSI